MLTFVWLVRFSSNLDHRLVMVWDKLVVVHAKASNDRKINAASIQVDMASRDENDKCKNICKRQDQISRNSGLTREPWFTLMSQTYIDNSGLTHGAASRGYDIGCYIQLVRPIWLRYDYTEMVQLYSYDTGLLNPDSSYRLLMSLQVSMILIGDKIESVTLEVGLVDAVSSSPASKEILGCFVLKAGCYKLVSEPRNRLLTLADIQDERTVVETTRKAENINGLLRRSYHDSGLALKGRDQNEKMIKKWEHIARFCCMGQKWFQRGTIDHFLMTYSHAKCGVTGDEPKKERRNERSKRTNEILETAIADSKYVLDIEHLEGSLPRIYGTIFPMNLKPMTTDGLEAIVLMNWLALIYANMNCRNKNIMVLKAEMKWMEIHGK
ncbi:hypothetical protein L2E82_48007 [Cichorium intybus]|uniref:Uncharacterized protein n=1 Tax=Cichorium intybus TaxID=13427 RepID=A0ACB8YWZ2_CICIN|nr:hypothetical protein L2E82_48007 [Cichorium intybus]